MAAGSITSRVFHFTAPRKLELHSEETPSPGPGEIRCRTICSMVSMGTEMICYERNVEPGSSWDGWIQYPFTPGYLSIGQVIDVGAGVTRFTVGDRVCSTAPHREWFVDLADKCLAIPTGLSSEHAAWFQLNIIAQNGLREVNPVFGESAVVIGLGPLGQLAVRMLGLCGLAHLVAIDPLAMRCDLARGCGPTAVFAGNAGDYVQQVHDLTGGRGADMVFDFTGHPAVFHTTFKMLAKRGRLGLVGDVPKPSLQTMSSDVINKGVSIISAHGSMPPFDGTPYHRWGRREMCDYLFGRILDGRINMDGMVTHRITPEQAPATYADILANRGKYMGVIIRWQDGV